MITNKARIMIVVILIIMIIWLIRQVRNFKLDLRYTLSWFFLTVALLLLSLFPSLLTGIARFMGIYSPVNMIFFCGFLFSLVVIYTLTIAVSKMSNEIRRLTQEIALIKEKQEETVEKTQ